jgi:hypothetical protein
MANDHATTADPSDRKHEDFGAGSTTPARAEIGPATVVNHVRGNFPTKADSRQSMTRIAAAAGRQGLHAKGRLVTHCTNRELR